MKRHFPILSFPTLLASLLHDTSQHRFRDLQERLVTQADPSSPVTGRIMPDSGGLGQKLTA
uniref:Secreted protein n=1 Tax=Echinococcus granulosus TaxID=6210 RepID=A0A068WV34_ECHGR|nr:hypothetical protein EgrG_000146150 [Echinococcus granulosus]